MCIRYLAQPFGTTVPSKLPAFRVNISRPFANTGVHFAGLLHVKEGKSTKKVTRTMHLELTRSMKVESFIQTLRRFIARRRVPKMLISDIAKIFKKTSERFKKLYKSCGDKKFLQ